jgi:hypothetical protein
MFLVDQGRLSKLPVQLRRDDGQQSDRLAEASKRRICSAEVPHIPTGLESRATRRSLLQFPS